MIIDFGVHGLVVRIERGFGNRRLVHENHREVILRLRSRDPLSGDHARAIVIRVSIVISEHGENVTELRMRYEGCAHPIVNQSRLDLQGNLLTGRSHYDPTVPQVGSLPGDLVAYQENAVGESIRVPGIGGLDIGLPFLDSFRLQVRAR